MNPRTFQPAHAHRLEDPQRLLWMPPQEVIGRLDLRPGMAIADIGAGTGFFALPFARMVGEVGMVWAVDLQPSMLKMLEEKLRQEGHPGNVGLRQGDAANTGLTDRSCDRAFLGNLWHELDDPRAVLSEVRRVLRPGGRIGILDWRSGAPYPPGPPPEDRVPSSETEALLKAEGWHNLACSELGPHSYLLVASAE
jgi:ubiquinone/menaquinone biosynthesis C-methylase UbiE